AICRPCARRSEVPVLSVERGRPSDPALARGWRGLFVAVALLPWRPAPWLASGPVRTALIFGFAATFAGYAMALGWSTLLARDELLALISEALEDETLPETQLLAVPWLGLPMVALARLVAGAFAFHLGTRLFAAAPRTAWSANTRFFALSSVTMALCAVPGVGAAAAGALWCAASVAMVRRTYGTGTARAVLAARIAAPLASARGRVRDRARGGARPCRGRGRGGDGPR
ncbi:MAG: hypothetical protein ACO3XL_08830, partial [Gemmobacter sp.]